MQIATSLQPQSDLRRLFIENVDDRKVVTFALGDGLRTCNPLASLWRMEQVRHASSYASFLVNRARDINHKPHIDIGPVVTVGKWNLIIASALTEQIETRRFLQ